MARLGEFRVGAVYLDLVGLAAYARHCVRIAQLTPPKLHWLFGPNRSFA
jgi:hypothetical protein